MTSGGDAFFKGQPKDPRFPRRPAHPDMERLGEILRSMDSAVDNGGRIPDVTFGLIDDASLRYAAEQRALMAAQALVPGRTPPALQAMLAGMWIDAFTAGARFMRSGGHQEP